MLVLLLNYEKVDVSCIVVEILEGITIRDYRGINGVFKLFLLEVIYVSSYRGG